MDILNGYRIKDLIHLNKLHNRHRRRNKIWLRDFREALNSGSLTMPFPVIIQILVTERCNLFCKMCNQWGERGYYSSHKDAVGDAPIEKLITFLQSIESSNFLLSIHGGEPFCYKHMDELLDYVIETERDTVFTTNATLLNRYVPKLGRLKNAMYIVSIDGDQDTNDRIRGKGIFQRVKDNLANLKKSCLEESGLMPLLSMNFCISEYIVSSDIIRAYKAARELGLLNINYGLRWYVTDLAGRDYERQLREEFQVSVSDCWKALRGDFSSFEAKGIARAISRVKNKFSFRLRLPYVSIIPREATNAGDIERHFLEHSYSFGREKCLFPFYFVRVHSNGDVIFCPGYRDIIVGNAFCDDFQKVINSDIARKFRKFCLHNRFSICSKCCGLYLSYAVDKLARNELID